MIATNRNDQRQLLLFKLRSIMVVYIQSLTINATNMRKDNISYEQYSTNNLGSEV